MSRARTSSQNHFTSKLVNILSPALCHINGAYYNIQREIKPTFYHCCYKILHLKNSTQKEPRSLSGKQMKKLGRKCQTVCIMQYVALYFNQAHTITNNIFESLCKVLGRDVLLLTYITVSHPSSFVFPAFPFILNKNCLIWIK